MALTFTNDSPQWIRRCLFDIFALEGVLEISVYSLFGYWLVNGIACDDGLVCENLHNMDIVMVLFAWAAVYIPFKVICGILLYKFITNEDCLCTRRPCSSGEERRKLPEYVSDFSE